MNLLERLCRRYIKHREWKKTKGRLEDPFGSKCPDCGCDLTWTPNENFMHYFVCSNNTCKHEFRFYCNLKIMTVTRLPNEDVVWRNK